MSQEEMKFFYITTRDGKLSPRAAFLRQHFGPDSVHRVSLQEFFDLLGLSDSDMEAFVAENGPVESWTDDFLISFSGQPNELVLITYEPATDAADGTSRVVN